jgi:hypothetical protein
MTTGQPVVCDDLYADVDRALAQLGLAEHDTLPPTAPQVAAEGKQKLRVTATVPVGKNPHGVAVDPGTHSVYVTDYFDGDVAVIERR